MADAGGSNDAKRKDDFEGPDSLYVKLVANDGHVFKVLREHAYVSSTIRAMLSGPGHFPERASNEIHFKNITSEILAQVIKYLEFKVRHSRPDRDGEVPNFYVPPDLGLGLLVASNFLDI